MLLVEPVFPVAPPSRDSAWRATSADRSLGWDCAFRRGLQQVALPLPRGSAPGRS